MVSICKPAGVICKVILETCYLTDEEKETVAELLLIDDDTILVNDELLKGWIRSWTTS